MIDIIERLPSYSNEAMLEYCEQLSRVISETREVKEGRGKAVYTVIKPKYDTPNEIVERIKRSCDYYKKLLDEETFVLNGNVTFRDYQIDIARKANEIVRTFGFVYLSMQVRTGKTFTSLLTCEHLDAQRVLFVTKKKAIGSVTKDYNKMKPSFYMCIINYDSLHTVMDEFKWDVVILDEAHSLGAFPKPSERAKLVRKLIEKCCPNVILMSGTPTPESYSQMYHQVSFIPLNPFGMFSSFYRFADKFVDVKQKKVNGLLINDYSRGKDEIIQAMSPYTLSYTQQQAGFVSEITETVLEVEMSESTYRLISRLKKDLVIEGKNEVILADTPVKLMSKLHQLYSGTVKFESGNSMVVDKSKAEFIKKAFNGSKIAIFYKFKEELSVLEEVFGEDLTTELSVFEDTNKNIALQIVSGREGLSLKDAEYIVYYNIDFSATSYWQSRDRMTTMERRFNDVYWIFSKGGIEHDIYKAVSKKKTYTVRHFKKFIE